MRNQWGGHQCIADKPGAAGRAFSYVSLLTLVVWAASKGLPYKPSGETETGESHDETFDCGVFMRRGSRGFTALSGIGLRGVGGRQAAGLDSLERPAGDRLRRIGCLGTGMSSTIHGRLSVFRKKNRNAGMATRRSCKRLCAISRNWRKRTTRMGSRLWTPVDGRVS
jgi:hypothetical protein